ncbi:MULTISPECIES: hypothetical protein [Methylosinus]|uniref:hypothetical protein n=1 Tax=Methylosinus sp. 3S-1 TaxID=1849840 RepID=UPI0012DD90B8|nr:MULTISPECIES: hypothetical protein [Methylosinus]
MSSKFRLDAGGGEREQKFGSREHRHSDPPNDGVHVPDTFGNVAVDSHVVEAAPKVDLFLAELIVGPEVRRSRRVAEVDAAGIARQATLQIVLDQPGFEPLGDLPPSARCPAGHVLKRDGETVLGARLLELPLDGGIDLGRFREGRALMTVRSDRWMRGRPPKAAARPSGIRRT